MLNEIIESCLRVNESSIDYPRMDLDASVWDKTGDTYKLKSSIKDKILSVLKQIPTDGEPVKCKINVIGSICTNQFTEEADVDVHVQPQNKEYNTEEYQKKVTAWFDENRERIGAYIGTHPIEVYIQTNPSQDMLADGCYDLIHDKWLRGPMVVDSDYDPYEDFSDILPEVEKIAKGLDITLGELKREVIDFETIANAIRHLPDDQRKKLTAELEKKRDEVEGSVRDLYKQRKVYIDARHDSSKTVSTEQAKKDVEMAKGWRDANAVHKFMNRYKYTRLISDMAKMLKSGDELDNQEIDKIGDMV